MAEMDRVEWYRPGEATPALVAEKAEDEVRIVELFGLPAGTLVRGSVWHDGPALVDTDDDRLEARSWRPVSWTPAPNRLDIVHVSADGGLELSTRYAFDPATGVLSRRDTLANRSARPTRLRRAFARFSFGLSRYQVIAMQCGWCWENQLRVHELAGAGLVFHSRRGRWTEGTAPYFALVDSDAGRGLAFHLVLAPGGDWRARIDASVTGSDRTEPIVELGFSDEEMRLTLAPGQALAWPEILIQSLPDGRPEPAAPSLQRFLVARAAAEVGVRAHRRPPLAYNTWFDRFDRIEPERCLRQLDAAAEAGFETLVVDAGWFGGDNWWTAAGRWVERTDGAFRGRMSEFADAVRARGLAFGFWMEPERFGCDAPIHRERPDWFVETGKGNRRMRSDIPEPWAWTLDAVSRLLEKYQAGYLKWDFNRELGRDETGRCLTGYYERLDGMLSRLRERFPETVFENCASGGMRLEPGRDIPFDIHLPSDSVSPGDLLSLIPGTWLRFPPGRLISWSVIEARRRGDAAADERYTPYLSPIGASWSHYSAWPLDFSLTAMLLGVPGFSGDLASLSSADRARMRQFLEAYKRRRDWLVDGAAHLLTPLRRINDAPGVAAMQRQSLDGRENVVLAFKTSSDDRAAFRFRLRNLDAGATYEILDLPGEDAPRMASGPELMERGLAAELAGGVAARAYAVTRKR